LGVTRQRNPSVRCARHALCGFFKYDVIHARLFQVVADGEAGLTASDDDDGLVIVHSEQFSFLLTRTKCFTQADDVLYSRGRGAAEKKGVPAGA
jgi:hypothetical protein